MYSRHKSEDSRVSRNARTLSSVKSQSIDLTVNSVSFDAFTVLSFLLPLKAHILKQYLLLFSLSLAPSAKEVSAALTPASQLLCNFSLMRKLSLVV